MAGQRKRPQTLRKDTGLTPLREIAAAGSCRLCTKPSHLETQEVLDKISVVKLLVVLAINDDWSPPLDREQEERINHYNI